MSERNAGNAGNAGNDPANPRGMRTITVVALVAVVVAGLAAMWWSRDETGAGTAGERSAAADKGRAGNTGVAGNRAPASGSSGGSSGVIRRGTGQAASDIARLYETTHDRRALFDQLDKSDAVEAPYFAARILRQCAEVSRVGFTEMTAKFTKSQSGTLAAARVDAYRKLYEPCRQFDGRKSVPEEIAAKEAEGVRRGDPRAQALAIATRPPADRSEAMREAARLLETDDPYVIHELGSFLGTAGVAKGSVNGLKVAESDRTAMFLAWTMVACDYGLDCGPESNAVLSACAFGTSCAMGSVDEVIRASWSKDAHYQTALDLRQRIVDALQLRDHAALGIGQGTPSRR